MVLFRTEYNVQTGTTVMIAQSAYASQDGDIIVLDGGVVPPEGYTEIMELPEE